MDYTMEMATIEQNALEWQPAGMSQMTTASHMSPTTYWIGPRLAVRLLLFHASGFFVIAVNILSLLVLRRVRGFHDATRLFMQLLSVADLISGCMIIVTEDMILVLRQAPSPPFCEISFPLLVSLVLTTLFLLGCLSLDRFVAITRPLRYPTLMTRKRAAIIAAGAVISACVTGVSMLSRRSPVDNVHFDENYSFCSIRGFDSEVQIAVAFGGVVAFCLLAATTCVNVKLLWIACKQVKRNRIISVRPPPTCEEIDNVSGSKTNGTDPVAGHPVKTVKISRYQEMKALRTVLVMSGAMYMGFFPITIHAVIYAMGLGSFGEFYEFFCYFMVINNSWFNPVINMILNSNYRKETARLLRMKTKS